MTPIAACAVVVPVYNERQGVAATIARLKSVVATVPDCAFEIICVDDGSTDGSGEILAGTPGITVIEHSVNRGYGAALKTGLDRTRQDWVFITDADGTYRVEDLPVLMQEARAGADMVVGARHGLGISRNPIRQFARWLLRKMVHGLTGVMVPDLNSGMRLFPRALANEFRHLLPRGFSFTSTITVAMLYSGYVVRYVPTPYARRAGQSNINPLRDFLAFTILIIRIAMYFEPLRFVLPLSIGIFLLAIVRGARDLVVTNSLGSLTVVMFLVALQVFVLGVIVDVIVRRSGIDHGRSGLHRNER